MLAAAFPLFDGVQVVATGVLRGAGDTRWPWVIVLVGVAGLLAVWTRRWRQPTWRASAGVAVVGALAMVVAWHGDGQEVTRHTVEGFAQLRLGLWILVVLGALGGPPEPRDSAPPGRAEVVPEVVHVPVG